MKTLTINENMVVTLTQTQEAAEIRDQTGELIGYFTPACVEDESWYEKGPPPLDLAELKRREQEPGPRLTTSEVLEYLQTLATDPDVLAKLNKTIKRVAARHACDTP